MTEGQFYIRLILNFIVGIMFAYALYRMAGHNNKEEIAMPHRIMHIIGWIFIGLSIFFLCLLGYDLTIVDFPILREEEYIGSYAMDHLFYWELPTFEQNSALTMALAIFDCLGVGVYFLCFKSSNSKWWEKLCKFLTAVLLYIFMASATNFHYFEFPEFIAPILFFILWFLIVTRRRRVHELINVDKIEIVAFNANDTVIPNESLETNSSKYAPKDSTLIETEISQEYHKNSDEEENASKSLNSEKDIDSLPNDMMFCRFCGKKIEADSIFCRYCGGHIKSVTPKVTNVLREIAMKLFKSTIHRFRNLFKCNSANIHISKMKNNNSLKKTLKYGGISLVIIVVCGGIAAGLWYYVYQVKPQKEAERILNSEGLILNRLREDDLFDKCNDIIRNHNIPKCGKYDNDRDNLSELSKIAWKKIERLAYAGNVDAQFMLGVKYSGYDYLIEDWNVLKYHDGSYMNSDLDYFKAAYWFLKAAEQNHGLAQNNIGICYKEGQGVEKNMKEAVKWFRLSAQNGNDYGELNIGDCFRDGYKVEIGDHWEKDVDAGYHSWEYKLGYHKVADYEIVIHQDIDSAKYYWQKSANQGNLQAKERLQKIY